MADSLARTCGTQSVAAKISVSKGRSHCLRVRFHLCLHHERAPLHRLWPTLWQQRLPRMCHSLQAAEASFHPFRRESRQRWSQSRRCSHQRSRPVAKQPPRTLPTCRASALPRDIQRISARLCKDREGQSPNPQERSQQKRGSQAHARTKIVAGCGSLNNEVQQFLFASRCLQDLLARYGLRQSPWTSYSPLLEGVPRHLLLACCP
mmetsp:Transcript_6867/g.16274  ORF Transcript_6867/g.16274 Transcript_6867/m.16274 type:complete len:206 (-) Transcript_6867:231-848(-)